MNSPDPPSVTANLTRSPGRGGGISARLHCQVIMNINSNFDLLLGESELNKDSNFDFIAW